MQDQIGKPEGDDKPNKKYYDQRKWLHAGQLTLIARVEQEFKDLNALDRNLVTNMSETGLVSLKQKLLS